MKKVIAVVFVIGFALAVIIGQMKPFEIKVDRYETTILPIEHTLSEELANNENLDLLFYNGEYAVFTTSREMKNQRMVGSAIETANIAPRIQTSMHCPDRKFENVLFVNRRTRIASSEKDSGRKAYNSFLPCRACVSFWAKQ